MEVGDEGERYRVTTPPDGGTHIYDPLTYRLHNAIFTVVPREAVLRQPLHRLAHLPEAIFG